VKHEIAAVISINNVSDGNRDVSRRDPPENVKAWRRRGPKFLPLIFQHSISVRVSQKMENYCIDYE